MDKEVKEQSIIKAYIHCTVLIECYEDAQEKQVWAKLLTDDQYSKTDQFIRYSLAEGVPLKDLFLDDLHKTLKDLESRHDIDGLLKRFQVKA